MKKIIVTAIVAVVTIVTIGSLTACNVTRKVTTEATYYQRGDTTVNIVTRTTETYDASKK